MGLIICLFFLVSRISYNAVIRDSLFLPSCIFSLSGHAFAIPSRMFCFLVYQVYQICELDVQKRHEHGSDKNGKDEVKYSWCLVFNRKKSHPSDLSKGSLRQPIKGLHAKT